MGGTFVEKSVKVTYLIAEKVGGERYRDACAIAVSIMKPDWIDYLWTNRRNSNLNWQISEVKLKSYFILQTSWHIAFTFLMHTIIIILVVQYT